MEYVHMPTHDPQAHKDHQPAAKQDAVKSDPAPAAHMTDLREGTIAQRKLVEGINKSGNMQKAAQLQAMINNSPRMAAQRVVSAAPVIQRNATAAQTYGPTDAQAMTAGFVTNHAPNNYSLASALAAHDNRGAQTYNTIVELSQSAARTEIEGYLLALSDDDSADDALPENDFLDTAGTYNYIQTTLAESEHLGANRYNISFDEDEWEDVALTNANQLYNLAGGYYAARSAHTVYFVEEGQSTIRVSIQYNNNGYYEIYHFSRVG